MLLCIKPHPHQERQQRVAAALPVVFYFGVCVNRLEQPQSPCETHVSSRDSRSRLFNTRAARFTATTDSERDLLNVY